MSNHLYSAKKGGGASIFDCLLRRSYNGKFRLCCFFNFEYLLSCARGVVYLWGLIPCCLKSKGFFDYKKLISIPPLCEENSSLDKKAFYVFLIYNCMGVDKS